MRDINRLHFLYGQLEALHNELPDWRFMQILSNTGIDEIDFYEESVDTFNRIRRNTIY